MILKIPNLQHQQLMSNHDKTKRRFYRNVDDKIIGGVCSGLAAYFNTDVSFVRIIFILFAIAGGAAFPIYIILWISLPAPHTSAQKLEMHGEDIKIEKTVRKEFEPENQKSSNSLHKNWSQDFIEDSLHLTAIIFRSLVKGTWNYFWFIANYYWGSLHYWFLCNIFRTSTYFGKQ